MAALAVNPPVHQFGFEGLPPDNAQMHKAARRTPLGRLMASYEDVGIGDNALARILKKRGTPVPQSTITRIANGTTKEAKEAALKPIAEFFGVTTAFLRGDEPAKAAAAKGKQAAERAAQYSDLSPEALQVARTWMQLSPGRRMKFLEDMAWAKFFEGKFPPYRIGIANVASHDKFERSVEADWDKMMRQAKLPLE